MKVLMTADTVGSVWTYAMDLCRALEGHGVKVMLATMGPAPTPGQREQARSCPNVRLRESCYALEWMEDPWNDVRDASTWLLRLRDELNPDVVHLNGYCHASLDWQRPVLVAAHGCLLSRWEAVTGEPAPGSLASYRKMVSEGIRSADMVVAPTAAMLEAVQRHYGKVQRPRVIANGRDPSLYAPGPKRKVVLSTGQLGNEAHHLASLQKAAEMVRWPIEVAGGSEQPDEGQQAWRGMKMLGELPPEQLARAYACASIYALPAKYEPSGMASVEAALSGCALVLGDIPSQRETWGDAAMYVSPDDPGGLASAINGLIADNPRRAGMALVAWRRAMMYSARQMANRYVGAYRELIGGSSRIATTTAKAPIVLHA